MDLSGDTRERFSDSMSLADKVGAAFSGPAKAAVILGVVIILVYGEVAFLGYTLSPAVYTHGVLSASQYGSEYGYHGRWLYYSVVMDPLATGGQNWPVYELISSTLRSGQIPLWNPYQGAGAPLAADTTWSTYFPIDLLYVGLPNQYWDFVWLFKLWIAGFLSYLFLRKLGLSSVPATGGGLAYSLSGALIFYPFMPWTNVAIMTPALLLVAKRSFDRSFDGTSVALGAIVVTVSLLGAHIEALVIQFLYVGLFVLFEVVTRKKDRIRGLATCGAVLILGFGLAAFYLLPVFEYLLESPLAHGSGVGLSSFRIEGNPVIWWVTLFVPYFYGALQTYPFQGLRQVFFWDLSPGYIGTVAFFLSLFSLFSLAPTWRSERTRYLIFFILGEALVLMKIFGLPPVSWIGSLPVLMYVIFTRYSGPVLAMSFAGACAFGIESVAQRVDRSSSSAILHLTLGLGTRHLRILATVPSLIVLVAVVLPALTTIPFPVSPSNSFFPISLACLALSLFFLILSNRMALKGGASGGEVLVGLVVLELASYVPKSLPAGYEALKVAMLAGAAVVVVGLSTIRLRRFVPRFPRSHTIQGIFTKNRMLAIVVVSSLVLQFLVSGASPLGLPNRHDAFTEAPYVSFLRANVGYQRVYSLDGVFFPPVAGVFSIQNLGEFSAFMPSSFRIFSKANLDRGSVALTLVGNAYVRTGTIGPSVEIHENIEFYSLLGVKYFVAAYTDLSIVHETSLQPSLEGSHSWAPLGNNTVSTQFVTDESFAGILVNIGTYSRRNVGEVMLVLDSVPGNAMFHRESVIRAESISNGNANSFPFSEVRLAKKTEFKITLHQSETQRGNELAVMWWPQVKPDPHLAISAGFLNIALGIVQRDYSLPVVYHDQNGTIYQNLNAFPRAFLVSHATVAQNEEEAVLKVRDLGWNTRQTLVLEEKDLRSEPILTGNSESETAAGSAVIERYSPSEVAIRVEASRPSFLVLTDTYYPGWRAYVDGKPETIYRAYGVVRAVFVTAGSHEILFRYEPDSFKVGVTITLASASIVAILCAMTVRPFKNLVKKLGRRTWLLVTALPYALAAAGLPSLSYRFRSFLSRIST
jgi:hypothetical protein